MLGILNTLVYGLYFSLRIQNTEIEIIPRMLEAKGTDKAEFIDKEAKENFKHWCPLFHNFLILFGFLRLLYYFRFKKEFGQLV